jgi:hypothetical protein
MKKLLLCFTVILTMHAAFAQTWCPPGAVWHYVFNNPYMPYENGILQMEFTNTLTVNSIACKRISSTFFGSYNCYPGPNCQTQAYNWGYMDTYENNSVVYIYNPVALAFDTIADFNASVGDTWRMITNCPTPPNLTVTSVGQVTFNNVPLKTLQLAVPAGAYVYTVTMIEKIMSTMGGMYPTIGCIADVGYQGNFACYSDNNFLPYPTASPSCNYLVTSLRENASLQRETRLYPNPNNGNFQLEIDQAARICIYNLLGEEVYSSVFEKNEKINIEAGYLKPGAYILKSSTAGGSAQLKFIRQ